MNESKIQIKVGVVEFSGEGQQDWLASQLDKILEKVPELLKIDVLTKPEQQSNPETLPKNQDAVKKLPTLSIWLKDKNATVVQTKKFLATAAHIQLSGKNIITTTEVGAALKNANQTRLNNASDCLSQNVSKGYCEKDSQGFFVTVQGLGFLGINE